VSDLIVDASVAGKWFLPPQHEPFAFQAREVFNRFQQGQFEIVVPDLFWPEMANIFRKAVLQRRISRAEARASIGDLRSVRLAVVPTEPLALEALRIALEHSVSSYDAFYVALAAESQFPLLTADERLVSALGARFPMRWLGSL